MVVPGDRTLGRLAAVACFAFTLVAGGYLIANADSVGWRILGWTVIVLGALTAYRYWSMRIIVAAEGLTIVQPPVRRFVPWSDVEAIESGPGNNVSGAARCIHVITRDGEHLKSYAVQRSSDDSPDLAAALSTLRAALLDHRI